MIMALFGLNKKVSLKKSPQKQWSREREQRGFIIIIIIQ